MNQPTLDQIAFVKALLQTSIRELIEKDSDIFVDTQEVSQQLSIDARVLNRKLHEVAINHRLAYYLERNIENTFLSDYNVDIEYNRFYKSSKMVVTVDGLIETRPDIIIHSRIDETKTPQHYLVIEAKKEGITRHDKIKIEGFMSDNNYNYLFGLTISYCQNDSFILANLFYFNGQNIITVQVDVAKLTNNSPLKKSVELNLRKFCSNFPCQYLLIIPCIAIVIVVYNFKYCYNYIQTYFIESIPLILFFFFIHFAMFIFNKWQNSLPENKNILLIRPNTSVKILGLFRKYKWRVWIFVLGFILLLSMLCTFYIGLVDDFSIRTNPNELPEDDEYAFLNPIYGVASCFVFFIIVTKAFITYLSKIDNEK